MGMGEYYRGITRLSGTTYAACALAKLNVSLKIGSADRSGMHEVSGIFQTISMHDRVTLTKTSRGEAGVEGPFVRENIAQKALDELSDEVGRELSCRISIAKSIPMAAGMGGGSSDAAAVLRLADRAYGLNLSKEELQKVAERVGNDVSFLLYGGRALISGAKSHSIKRLESPRLYYLVAHPHMELSTKEMYALHDKTGKDFTELASGLCPDTKHLLKDVGAGAIEFGVTGKGPTVFAGYKAFSECSRAAKRLPWFGGEVFIERSVGAYTDQPL